MDEQTIKRDLIRVCHLMYERSYVVSSDGNVSVRLDDGRILATPTMTCKGRMSEDLIAITDLEGKALNDRRASSELAMHLLIYRERPDVKAGLPCASAARDGIRCRRSCYRPTDSFGSHPDTRLRPTRRLWNAVN
jgi:ribulose-5-phosphate 4-epimerase/fuculose-1-phosphate aldolase